MKEKSKFIDYLIKFSKSVILSKVLFILKESRTMDFYTVIQLKEIKEEHDTYINYLIIFEANIVSNDDRLLILLISGYQFSPLHCVKFSFVQNRCLGQKLSD